MTALRKYRTAYGHRQDKLASRVFISPGYLCDLEHGLKKPSPRLARAIADIFGAKVEAVFPEGCAEKVCRQRNVGAYVPPDESRPIIPYPREFRVPCRHCGTPIYLRTDDRHPITRGALCCVYCGAEFEVGEEARV
jgi:DNA-binding XRE family transcriptional regulator